MQNTLLIPGLENEKAAPDFSRLKDALLRTGKNDRLPFLELFADVEIVEAVLNRPMQKVEDEIEFWYRLGYDATRVFLPLYFPLQTTASRNTSEKAKSDRHWMTDDVSPIQCREDFERYAWPDPESVSVQQIEEIAGLLPEGMGMYLMSGGILENVMWLMGYTGLAAALYDDPQFVHDMFNEVSRRIYRAMERVIDCPHIGCVFFGEDMGFKTSTMIAPEHMRKYLFPELKKLADLTHKHGKFFVLHSCGNLEAIMDDLIDYVGIDAKHSFEDAIMPVAEFKKQYGNRIGVVGGVDVDVLTRMDIDGVRSYTRKVLEGCVPGGGYALGTGNSVTNYVKVENYLAMLEEGWRYRNRA